MHFTASIFYVDVAVAVSDLLSQGFVQISTDASWVQQSLAANVSAFLATHSDLVSPNVNHAFSWHDVKKALRGEADDNDWIKESFYVRWHFPIS